MILDFPNAPLLGDRYDAPNGASYFWDGVVWICPIGPAGVAGPPAVGGASGPAGGALAGTYPNPTLAPGAVNAGSISPPPADPADVGKVLTVGPGPTLTWSTPATASAVTLISATPPPAPVPGTLWFRPDPDGDLYVYYQDPNSSQWVPAMASVGSGGSAVTAIIESYRHVQATASTVWTVTHNLSFRPNVAVVDSTGREIWPAAVDHVNSTTISITFSAATAGEAFLS